MNYKTENQVLENSRAQSLKGMPRYFFALLLIVSIISCVGKDSVKPSTTSAPPPEISGENISSDKEILASSISQQSDEPLSVTPVDFAYNGDYIIGPDDLIEINVYQVDELKRILRVSSSGFIKLPLAGKIKVSGLTAPELEAELSKRYYKYLQEPVVSVFIKEFRSQRITVLGAVKKPQVHTVRNQNSLLDMLTLSGGLTNDAGEICYVRRDSETIVINLDELLIAGNTQLNIPVFAGDIIHFPVGGVLFVNGAVKAPGSFPVKGKLTLTEAISMAKGFNSVAIKSGVKVYRDTGKEKRDVIPVNYDAILAQKAPDILLQDKDIVIVPESAIKQFIQSLSGATSFGKVSLSGGL